MGTATDMVFYPGVILAFFESGKRLVEKTLEDVCTLQDTSRYLQDTSRHYFCEKLNR